MSTRFLGRALALAALIFLPVRSAHAQCLDWRTFPHNEPELDGRLDVLQVHDDGTGSALYLAGNLTNPSSSTPMEQFGVMRWDGHHATRVGTEPIGRVGALASFDNGNGPALFAGDTLGSQYRFLKWSGGVWTVLDAALNGPIAAFAVHDDGTGPALYAAGSFTASGTTALRWIAKWTGAGWQALGAGPGNPVQEAGIECLASFDDGTGPALYAGGTFFYAAAGSNFIAKWKNGAWSGVGGGTDHYVVGMVPWNDGSGPSLFVIGWFHTPGQGIARWDGSAWHTVGGGFTSTELPSSPILFDDGTGEKLYVVVPALFGQPRFARWDGSTWTSTTLPAAGDCSSPNSHYVFSLGVFDEGSGPRLFAGSDSGALGFPRGILSRQEGSSWVRAGPPLNGIGGSVRALHAHDDGSGPATYVGGLFCEAGEADVHDLARLDATGFHAVGDGPGREVWAMTTWDPGTGSLLVVANGPAAGFQGPRLSTWNGTSWFNSQPTGYYADQFRVLEPFAGDVYVGGAFAAAAGINSPNLVRWNLTYGFIWVGTGVNGPVNALAAFDDGSGPALYVGGDFAVASGTSALRVARYDGTSFSPLGSGMNAVVNALAMFDDGSGPALYAGGGFTSAGGTPAARVARWNGASWSPVGAGFDATVNSLRVFDDGSGPALYAGGSFTASGSTILRGIARWNGSAWDATGGGIDGSVVALEVVDDGTGVGPLLFAGGSFEHAGALPSTNLAAWRGCDSTPIVRFCFGDGADGACPCGNFGLSGRGCDNSVATGGARLNATGTTSPDTIVLHAGGELPNAPTLVFQGSVSLSQPILFGDGLRCVGGNLKRLFTTNAVGGALNVPDAMQVSISARSAALGDPLVHGSVRSYQTWYRDPNLSFCPSPSGNAWNLSNAVRIVW
jgi:hypothetical protein